MAPLKVSTSTFFKNSTKSKHPFYLIIFLVVSIFLILFCSTSSDDSSSFSKLSSATDTSWTIIPRIVTKRHLLSSTSSVKNLNTKKVNGGDTATLPVSSSSKSNRKVKFQGDAHEVPSGPNPISNR